MLPNLPAYISLLFILTTIITVWLFYRATNYNRTTLVVVLGWLALQAVLSFAGFYQHTGTIPPRLALLIGPPLIVIIGLFLSKKGQSFIDEVRLDQLTLLHSVRIVVEIVLLLLFIHKAVPEAMTFERNNFDILAGLTAPLVYYLAFVRKTLTRQVLLLWNILCLGLLINIVLTALLAAPTAFQQTAFDQPNIAIQYFPFVWLPAVVVPIVLFSHLIAIQRLRNPSAAR
jgi:hypothetical protein